MNWPEALFVCDGERRNVVSEDYGGWGIDKLNYLKGEYPLFSVVSRAMPQLAKQPGESPMDVIVRLLMSAAKPEPVMGRRSCGAR